MTLALLDSASGDGSSISTMTVNEFWTLLRDAKVANAGHGDNKSARLDLIFIKVSQTAMLPEDRVLKDRYIFGCSLCLLRSRVLTHYTWM